MRHVFLFGLALPLLGLAAPRAQAQEEAPKRDFIRIATWNIENWSDNFQAERDKKERPRPDNEWEDNAARQEGYQNDEDNWEIAQTILDENFLPDVLVFQEGAADSEVQSFKDKWLEGKYQRHIVFPGNSDRGQTLGMLLRPGLTVVETRDQYYKIPDSAEDINPRSDFLFARGPAFVLLETEDGYRFWVGTTHQKSKGGNDVPTTRWRMGEAAKTHEIMKELAGEGARDVVLLGDMNDELGFQEFEQEAGGDVIATLVGDDRDGFELLTRDLALGGYISYTGYWRPNYRSFIDHIVVTPEMADQVEKVMVVDTPWARVASDHLPVYVDVKPDSSSN